MLFINKDNIICERRDNDKSGKLRRYCSLSSQIQLKAKATAEEMFLEYGLWLLDAMDETGSFFFENGFYFSLEQKIQDLHSDHAVSISGIDRELFRKIFYKHLSGLLEQE